MDDRTNLDKVDYEREENLPPSALLGMGLGLLPAAGSIMFAGIGAIVSETSGGSALAGALFGAVVGVVLVVLFVNVEAGRLSRRGR